MTGFGAAFRLALRRSRMFYLWWTLGLSVILPMTVTKYHDLVPEGQSGQLVLAQLSGNPTMRAMLGPAFDLGNAGGFTFWRVGTFIAAAVGMMVDSRDRATRRGGRGAYGARTVRCCLPSAPSPRASCWV